MEYGRLKSEDLLIKVLICLPVRSIERFRCVSKSWCNLIKSSDFINTHLIKQQINGRMLLVKRYLAPPQDEHMLSFHDLDSPELEEVCPNLPIPFLKNLTDKYDFKRSRYHKYVQILGPCNGLVCICCDEYFFVCNPTLAEFEKLPHHFGCQEGYRFYNVGVGFGSTCINDFKVILIGSISLENYYTGKYRSVILLYNSLTNSWRQMDDDPLVKVSCSYDPISGFLFDGVCHWNVRDDMPHASYFIVCFDLREEVFSHLEYPDSINLSSGGAPFLFIFNECLAFVHCLWMESYYLDVWVMKKYGVKESWTKQYALEADVYTFRFRFLCPKNDRCMLVAMKAGQLASLALHAHNIEKFEVHGYEETLRAMIYSPSLISVKQLLEGNKFGRDA